jgi:hypothetical protein
MAIPKKKSTKAVRILFQLERGITKSDLKRGANKRDGQNVSRFINVAVKWYLHCLDTQDKGLERFLEEKMIEDEKVL